MTSARPENWTAAAEALSGGRSSVIWRRLVADTETPVGAAVKLIEEGRGDFLLESVEGGEIRDSYALGSVTSNRAGGLVGLTQGGTINRWWHSRAIALVSLETNQT